MKIIVAVFLNFIALSALSQQSQLLPTKLISPKVETDSVKTLTADSLCLDLFHSSGARIDNLKSTYLQSANYAGGSMLLSGVVAGNNGQFANLNVSGLTNLGTPVNGGVATFSSLKVGDVKNATPLFTDNSGILTKTSPPLFKAVGSAAFHPEIISPYVPPSSAPMGQISKFNGGELLGYSPSSALTYRFVAPLEISVNKLGKEQQSNIKIQNMKICVYDADGINDLAALVWRVNDSNNQGSLVTEAMMGLASDGDAAEYRCFDMNSAQDPYGSTFDLLQQENSYYISVFPYRREDGNLPSVSVRPWSIDNPGLKLVHVVLQYIHY